MHNPFLITGRQSLQLSFNHFQEQSLLIEMCIKLYKNLQKEKYTFNFKL